MKWDGFERRKNGAGRRAVDSRNCPFHEIHTDQIQGLELEMKRKIGFKTFALLVTAIIAIGSGVGGITYLALNKYVESATSSAVYLLKEHIDKSESGLEDINNQLEAIEGANRIIIYRLNRLDKTPEYPRTWPGPGPGNWGGFEMDPKL